MAAGHAMRSDRPRPRHAPVPPTGGTSITGPSADGGRGTPRALLALDGLRPLSCTAP